jgi:hypothetical protein
MKINWYPDINEHFCEVDYLKRLTEKLNFDDSINLIITYTNDYSLPAYDKNKRNVVIFISDEGGIIPRWIDKVDLMFRTYSRQGLHDDKKIFAIPCGYVGHKESNYVPEQPKKPLWERDYELFYSGQPSPNRVPFLYYANKIKGQYKSYITETTGFRQGLSINEYFNYLNNTKISLVPNGKVIPESFRYMESFESNCIVVTTYPYSNPKFNLWYYIGSPAIFLSDWKYMDEHTINRVLQPDEIKRYEYINKKYYQEKLSIQSVADYINNIVSEKIK